MLSLDNVHVIHMTLGYSFCTSVSCGLPFQFGGPKSGRSGLVTQTPIFYFDTFWNIPPAPAGPKLRFFYLPIPSVVLRNVFGYIELLEIEKTFLADNP